MSVVGVDFGNQNVVIAAAGRGGVDVVLNGNSNRQNPCMVCFDHASRAVGENAATMATSNYKNCIRDMKRLIGLRYDDPVATREMSKIPYKCVPLEGRGTIGAVVECHGKQQTVAIEAVVGTLMAHMGGIVAKKNGAEAIFPRDWVLSVPVYYTDAQRKALLDGCRVAGISVLRLMHETTATALAYGIFKDIRKEFADGEKTVLFIDLGATAYSVSVVAFAPGKLVVKSSKFDADLGGRDFDWAIAEWFASKFQEKFGSRLSAPPLSKPKVALKILAAAEKAKKTLSPAGVKEVRIQMECIMDDLDFGITLTAQEYENLCAPLLARLAAPIQGALEEAGVTSSDLASIEIVGGGSRVGCVKRTLCGILGTDPNKVNYGLSTTLNADEAVARGCALQSAILSPKFKVLPYDIQEYQTFPVAVSWEAGDGEETDRVVMFERGCNFPSVRRVTLRRSADFTVTASYDEASVTDHSFRETTSREICTFHIKIPPALVADGEKKKVRVNVKQDIHGCTTLSSTQIVEEIVEEGTEDSAKTDTADDAKEAEGDKDKTDEAAEKKKKTLKKTNLEFTVVRKTEMTPAEHNAAYEAEVEMNNQDRIAKETADMRNELESYIYDMRDKIISDDHLAPFSTESERKNFGNMLETVENWLYEDGFDATKKVYSEKLASLRKIGDPIQRRQKESNGRPAAVAALQRTVEKFKSKTNETSADPKYGHITDDERNACHKACDECSSWMYEALDKQANLPPHSDPFVTVLEIQQRCKLVVDTVSPILNRPAPAPEKPKQQASADSKPEEKKETPATDTSTNEKKTEADNDTTPMDTSV